ncbi:uncharacterized protein LOC110019668 [Phalaenopsis equestris]|uniref:uncharacterized protein LOC110019668 n=2 Tax=Phalaenopsis equestris TaxID=78828 RepID=UPI0009E3D9E7|nr:uncharacterized protein LOC110019668 [Phalaenopsis equestris]
MEKGPSESCCLDNRKRKKLRSWLKRSGKKNKNRGLRLPGLNKCYISEDETTKAFHQFYPVPAPYLTIHPDAAVSGIASDDILNQNQRLDNNACSIPSGVKTKNGLLDASNLPNSSSLSCSTSSGKKLKASSDNRALNDVVRNSLDKDSSLKHGIRQTSRSAELFMEKQNHKVEEKPFKIPASCPNEGDLFGKGCKNSKVKSRKQVDLGHRSSKKIKRDALHYSEKNVHAKEESAGKMAINGDYGLPPRASRKVLQNDSDHFSSEDFNSKFAPSKSPKKSIGALSYGEHKEHFTASRTEKNCKYDSNDEKRGIKENSMVSQQLVENRPMIKDSSGESEQRRQKKGKLANSMGQDFSAVIVDGKMGKKGSFTKIKLPSCEKYQPDKVVEATIDAFECVDGMNKDLTNVQLATTALPSSSKLLGSHRSKVNLHEARESPVESVSSSPIRLLNTKNNSKKVRLSTKDDILSTGPSMKCSPKNNFLGDVDAIDQTGTMTKDQASKSHLIISKNSKAAKPKASSNHLSQIVDRSEGRSGKMAQTCHTVTGQHEKSGWGTQTVHRSMKEGNSEQYHADAVNSGASNSTKNLRKSDCLDEIHSKNLSQPSPTVPEFTPTKRDGHININAFIQEARDLKHTASRLKNDGLERESSGIYFEASMKFLHVAFLMEPPNSEIERQGDFIPSLQMLTMYVDTARLCEFCAHEYENLKEMAAAALAYKCAEVAYMKVAYFKHPSASKDRHELQAALDAALPGIIGEPTTSTSDVDNPNNQEVLEKAASRRATRSPQLASSFVIAARNRPHVKRLLTYTNYLNCAFEATNKSRNALAAASIDLDEDRVASLFLIREVLDFNFNNVERLLQLVRVSLNSISCKV